MPLRLINQAFCQSFFLAFFYSGSLVERSHWVETKCWVYSLYFGFILTPFWPVRFLVLFLVVTTSEDRIYTIYICEMHLLCLLASFSGTLELTKPFFLELRGQKVVPCWLASPSWREFHFWMAETAGNLELQLVEKHESPTNWNIKEEWLLQLSWTIFRKYLEVKMGWFFEGPYPFSVACGRQNTCNQNTKQAP